ncbi:MAG: L-serine ammonia-lyase [Phycisphaerales bacterium]|nr:L-serine ammonia-lyase [Phycisphaerales bacterium]
MSLVSVFDMFKIGIGPSSSHTLGPWRIVQRFLRELASTPGFDAPDRLRFELLGSLALTGHGHATDTAIALAMLGEEPETVDVAAIPRLVADLAARRSVELGGRSVPFDPATDIIFNRRERHPGHANAIRAVAIVGDASLERVYFSLGGGFVSAASEGDEPAVDRPAPPHPIQHATDWLRHCETLGVRLSDVVLANERAWWPETEIRSRLVALWETMRASIRRGCRGDGVLPGGLNVKRRAPDFLRDVVPEISRDDIDRLMLTIRAAKLPYEQAIRIISCFAIAVNEENAAMGRVVTAPTNGAAGVIPAVMMYRACFATDPVTEDDVVRYLLTAGQVGALFKQNATISAAMGGCQAEIGVSSAMAAAGLAELMGATPGQALVAAEIAMEHHLGMTCDPVGGLVQIPCIERNAMGAVKAIAAAAIAAYTDPACTRVSLDDIIEVMWETAKEMNERYKETSLGGLAVRLSVTVGLAEC